MKAKKIAPSLMCVPISETKEYLELFEEENIEYLHVDIMDGDFVPNITLGKDYVKEIRRLSDIPLDIHLMVYEPENKLDWFEFGPGDFVSVHVESTPHIQSAISKINDQGAKAMAAINPGTNISTLDYLLDDIDGVLVMTVNPGFAGQKAIPNAIDKIKDVREYLNDKGYEDIEIQVDGNVSFELAEKMSKNGANIFVAGTSSFLNPNVDTRSGIKDFRKIIENEGV